VSLRKKTTAKTPLGKRVDELHRPPTWFEQFRDWIEGLPRDLLYAALTVWAVGFQELQTDRPLPRIGIHYGAVLYRDGDYYGRAVNLASRVGARAAGGEVLVTREVVDAAGRHLAFEPIGEVKLKGFREATDLFLARAA
jgi:hypothetical protein